MPKMHYKPSPEGGKKVYLAIPVSNQTMVGFTFSLYHSSEALSKAGIASELAIYQGDCHVDDARNRLVRDFLETNCTDLMFIDSDIKWNPSDLVKILSFDRDVVGATYPFKQDDEGYPVAMLPGDAIADNDGLVKVQALPTGFLRIKRHVLEKLATEAVKFKPKSDDRGEIPLIFERQVHNGYRRGGDYAFCKKWINHGEIYLAPEIELEHSGEHSWSGSYGHFKRIELFGPIIAGLEEIKAGIETPKTMIDLVAAWGNEWSVSADMLHSATLLARNAKSVLETGSGLTTLVMAAANQNIEITSLEHSGEWAIKVMDTAKSVGLNNIRLKRVNLVNGWYDYKTESEFDLVLVDGPPRNLGSREGIFSMNIRNATILMDDTLDRKQLELIENYYPDERVIKTIGQKERKFSISKVKNANLS